MAARKKPKTNKKPTLVGERKLGRVLITGASAGIGAELAREFAKHGHALVLVARSKDKLTALAGELNAAHDTEALVIVEDLSRKGCAQAIVDGLADRGVPPGADAVNVLPLQAQQFRGGFRRHLACIKGMEHLGDPGIQVARGH